jgi:hypothetical protein
LLSHRALEQVSGWLIVVWVWNDTCNQTDDSKRVNLHMRVKWSQLVWF